MRYPIIPLTIYLEESNHIHQSHLPAKEKNNLNIQNFS